MNFTPLQQLAQVNFEARARKPICCQDLIKLGINAKQMMRPRMLSFKVKGIRVLSTLRGKIMILGARHYTTGVRVFQFINIHIKTLHSLKIMSATYNGRVKNWRANMFYYCCQNATLVLPYSQYEPEIFASARHTETTACTQHVR